MNTEVPGIFTPGHSDIKDTFEQYVQSVDAALISQYDTHNINIA